MKRPIYLPKPDDATCASCHYRMPGYDSFVCRLRSYFIRRDTNLGRTPQYDTATINPDKDVCQWYIKQLKQNEKSITGNGG